MKVLTNLLKFVCIMILTVCIISISIITITFSTVLNKNYVITKLEQTDFYTEIYELVKSNFENYIYQSGLDETVLENICTEEKVKNDINIMLSNIYNGTDAEIEVTEIADNLNKNIENLGIKNKQNEGAINQFITHICEEYTNTLIHTKYETKINNIYKKTVEVLNKIYNVILAVMISDIIAIIIINNKKISKDMQFFGIALFAASIFELISLQIVNSKIDVNGIKIFNDVFSLSIVSIVKDIINQIACLAFGSIIIGIIFLIIYVAVVCAKISKEKIHRKE